MDITMTRSGGSWRVAALLARRNVGYRPWRTLLLCAGFGIGVLGHLTRSRTLVAIGVLVVMVGSAAFVVAVGRYG